MNKRLFRILNMVMIISMLMSAGAPAVQGAILADTRAAADAAEAVRLGLALPADNREPNNSFLQARDLGTLTADNPHLGQDSLTLGSVATGRDGQDYFRFALAQAETVNIEAYFSRTNADVQMELSTWWGRRVAQGEPRPDGAFIRGQALAPGHYLLRLWVESGRATDYNLHIRAADANDHLARHVASAAPADCPFDPFEPNDSFDDAAWMEWQR